MWGDVLGLLDQLSREMWADQLRLLEWRRAGLARRTHALLVLLVPRSGLLRDLAFLPPCRLPLGCARLVAVGDDQHAAARQASEAAEREQDRLEHAAARVPRQWRGGDDHCQPVAPARMRLAHAAALGRSPALRQHGALQGKERTSVTNE